MEIENLEILKIIASVNNKDAVSLRSIDMRIMASYPEVIFNKELLSRLNYLIDEGFISWVVENSSVIATQKGIQFLENNL